MYKLVLSGSTGYIGKNFIRILGNKYKIFCIVRERTVNDNVKKNDCVVISYAEEKELYGILESVKPDVVVHLAGVFLGNHAPDTIGEMIDCNIRFSTIFLDAAVKSGCHRIVNTGSYWQNYLGESYNPVNLYAATKQAFEDLMRYFQEAESLSGITMTIFDTYGPNDNRKKILNVLMKLKDGESIDMSSGEQKMYFCYIDDVINAFDVAIEKVVKLPDGIIEKYAIRSDDPVSLKDAVLTLLKISGKDIVINWGRLPYRKREIINPEGIGKIIPNWHAEIDLYQGLKMFSDSYKRTEDFC